MAVYQVTTGLWWVNYLVQSKIQNYFSGYIRIRFIHVRKLMLQTVNKTATAKTDRTQKRKYRQQLTENVKKKTPNRRVSGERRHNVAQMCRHHPPDETNFNFVLEIWVFFYCTSSSNGTVSQKPSQLRCWVRAKHTMCLVWIAPHSLWHRTQCSESPSHLSLFFVHPKTRFILQKHKNSSFDRHMVHFLYISRTLPYTLPLICVYFTLRFPCPRQSTVSEWRHCIT